MLLTKDEICCFCDALKKYDKVFLITDENVKHCCLPLLSDLLDTSCFIVITIEHGESNKNLTTASKIMEYLVEHNASRHSLIVNLGGGMVCDLGGFVASIFLRGIDFVNIPTTLLAMTDASVGGKTGVDFMGYKNLVGSFAEPKITLIIKEFLQTLPERELKSGMAEMLKYGFIIDKDMLKLSVKNYADFIMLAISLKQRVVAADLRDCSVRKILNFGHTAGHAVESYLVNYEDSLLHGECVALGMYCTLWLSVKLCGLNKNVINLYQQLYNGFFDKLITKDLDIERLVKPMSHDKKNHDDEFRFVLLKDIQTPVTDVKVSVDDVKEALAAMLEWQSNL